MPELPEVTTTVNGLRETVVGKKIWGVWTDWPKTVKSPSFPLFKKKVVGEKIVSIERCGKNILIHLSGALTILIHMKMTGHFLYGKYRLEKNRVVSPEGPLRDDPYNKYVHILFTLSGKNSLALSDARKFAKIKLLLKNEVATCSDLRDLGPDALRVSLKEFEERLKKKPRGKIKQVLMNQNILAGIGNIYSDELLWKAKIHPERKIETLGGKDCALLYRSMREVLAKGIQFRGDSDSDYRNVYGIRGDFQHHHNVYRKTGEMCPRKDGGVIKRIVIGGRSSHFCPVHQI